jgi:hypothetical protein
MNIIYLINATKKEYIVYSGYPEGVGTNLLILEKIRNWNLHLDDTIVTHMAMVYDYTNVTEFISEFI